MPSDPITAGTGGSRDRDRDERTMIPAADALPSIESLPPPGGKGDLSPPPAPRRLLYASLRL